MPADCWRGDCASVILRSKPATAKGVARLGGNHTWSFYQKDLTPAQLAWLQPMVVGHWPAYEVRFPTHRRTLDTEQRPLTCLNCGAPVPAGNSASCDHCASPLVVFDLQRLMASVMVRHGLPLPEDEARHVSWRCRSCGDAVDPTTMTACARCGHTVLAPSLDDAMPLLTTLEPRLRQFRAPGAQPMGATLRRQRGFRGTAFFRHMVAPFGRGAGADWRERMPAVLLLAVLLVLWYWLRRPG